MLLCYLQNYQALITGLIGFSGVIIALVVNARLTRNMEKEKIHRETNALRRALKEEMNVQRDDLMNTTSRCTDASAETADCLIPVLRFSGIFDAAIERLGLLERQEVEVVLNAYLPLKCLTPTLQTMASKIPPHERGVEYAEKPAEYVLIGREDIQRAGNLHRGYARKFDDAIRELSSRLH